MVKYTFLVEIALHSLLLRWVAVNVFYCNRFHDNNIEFVERAILSLYMCLLKRPFCIALRT